MTLVFFVDYDWLTFPPIDRDSLRGLRLAGLNALRRLTFHVVVDRFTEQISLLEALSTITSPALSEFVLEALDPPPYYIMPPSTTWRRWKTVDAFLEERFAQRREFKVIVKTAKLKYNWKALQMNVEVAFPLFTRRGCIHFKH